jgi:glutamyl-tRNA synthetase
MALLKNFFGIRMYRFSALANNDLPIQKLQAALLSFLCAKKDNTQLIVRVEDYDANESGFLEILQTFGITYDRVYFQSQNRKFHHQLAAKLLSDSKAFSCFCTDENLKLKEDRAKKSNQIYHYDGTCQKLSDNEVLNNQSPLRVRLKMPNGPIGFYDGLKGEISFEPEAIDSFVILSPNKTPQKEFATAIDDMLQGVKFLILDDNHELEFAREGFIHQSLGFNEPIKISSLASISFQANEHSSLQWLLNQGYLPQAIANYLILLAANAPERIFTLKEALDWFSFKKLKTSKMVFDLKELNEINKEHIKRLDPIKLAALLDFSGEDFGKIVKLYLFKYHTLNGLKSALQTIFGPKEYEGENKKEFDRLKLFIQEANHFEELSELKSYLLQKSQLEDKSFFELFYFLLTGSHEGPCLEELYPLIKNYLKEIVR